MKNEAGFHISTNLRNPALISLLVLLLLLLLLRILRRLNMSDNKNAF